MCGRFVSSSPPDELARYFGAAPPESANAVEGAPADPAAVPGAAGSATPPAPSPPAPPAASPLAPPVPSPPAASPAAPGGGFEANFNVAPSTDVFAVYRDRDLRRLDTLHWGLVPSWAKDVSVGNRMINARAETVADSGAFRRPFARRRCIIPADGFYEWSKVPGHRKKQPYFVHRVDDEPLAFAGLWEIWRGPRKPPAKTQHEVGGDQDGDEGIWLRSCTIITTAANATMAPVHDRMPVILPPSAWEAWLDPDNHDTEALGRLLRPAPEGLLALHPVSLDVSNVRNGGAHLIDEVDTIDPDGTGGRQPDAPDGAGGPAAERSRTQRRGVRRRAEPAAGDHEPASDDGQASLFDPGH